MTIESDYYENWPAGPKIGAQSAILIDADTGAMLYEKNIHEHLYPASVTKILTALVAVQNSNLDDMVTFSYDAVNSIDWRTDANMGIKGGNSITMEQCLYGLLVGSANEAAYAIAEHICGNGNLDDFAALMNKTAESLGCTDSNFVTPNGIHDDNHYTSVHDLSLIAKAFFSNPTLVQISGTSSYTIPQTDTQPNPDMHVYAKSKLFPGKEYAYDGLIGTKTGYTEYARQTLVSCAERSGVRLICVIMKEETPYQYTDTRDLFDYGFSNFEKYNISSNDNTYDITNNSIFNTNISVFGSSKPLMHLDTNSNIILPVGAAFSDATSIVDYENPDEGSIARVMYYYNDIFVGSALLIPEIKSEEILIVDNPINENKVIFINVISVLKYVLGFSIVFILIFIIREFILRKKQRGKNPLKSPKTYKLKIKKQ